MLTAAEITWMRATEALTLPDTCAVHRKSSVSDGRGGQTESYAVVSGMSTLACRLSAGGNQADESITAEQMRNRSYWIITFTQGVDVRDTDRIVIGSRTFEVMKALAHGAWEMARRVQCVEVT